MDLGRRRAKSAKHSHHLDRISGTHQLNAVFRKEIVHYSRPSPGVGFKKRPPRAQTSAIAERNAMIPGRAPPPPRRILAVAHILEATTRTTGTPLSIIQKRLWRGRNPPGLKPRQAPSETHWTPGGFSDPPPRGALRLRFLIRILTPLPTEPRGGAVSNVDPTGLTPGHGASVF